MSIKPDWGGRLKQSANGIAKTELSPFYIANQNNPLHAYSYVRGLTNTVCYTLFGKSPLGVPSVLLDITQNNNNNNNIF